MTRERIMVLFYLLLGLAVFGVLWLLTSVLDRI